MEAVLFFCIIASSGNRYFLSCNPAEQGCFKPQILSVGDWIFFNFVVKDGFVGFPEWRDSEQSIYDCSSSSYKKTFWSGSAIYFHLLPLKFHKLSSLRKYVEKEWKKKLSKMINCYTSDTSNEKMRKKFLDAERNLR